MIGSLRGRLLELFGDGEVLIEVGGVGYRVIVTPTTAVRRGDVGGDVFVHVHHHIREADQTLYGFLERDERTCFEALLSAHGVGPSLALAVLEVHGPVGLARRLAAADGPRVRTGAQPDALSPCPPLPPSPPPHLSPYFPSFLLLFSSHMYDYVSAVCFS